MTARLQSVPGTDPLLAAALAGAGLPTDDLSDPGRRFAALVEDGVAVAWGGVEGEGEDQLLRSVVVRYDRRGRGLARELAVALAADAERSGCRRLWLLTTSADAVFTHLGWHRVPRTEAPPAIAATRQFTALCPSSAVVMVRALPL